MSFEMGSKLNWNIDTPPREGEDFYYDERGLMVFTAAYHLKRGRCCGSGCRHCPYEEKDE